MSKSSEYWKGRFDQVEQAANTKSVKYTKELEKKYQAAAKDLDGQINAWYQRIADNNGVSITEARKMLTDSELKEFKWSVEEYIKYGQENAIDQRWMKELENASAKFHINRLEALKLEARQQVEQLFAGGQESMFDVLGDIYKETFYKSCFEIQKGVGVGFDVSKLDDGQVSKILSKPWSVDGTNFSEKLWGNKRKLINTLDQELSRMILTGESPQKAIQNIRKTMDTSLYAAKRLVLTESAYFTTLAQKDCFNELDVEEYEIVATLDNRTSDICQEMDGKHFPVSEMSPGVNAPPFHVFCRSTTCPYFDDEFSAEDMRVARDDEGNIYEVPANMKYPEWKKSFVDGGSKDDLKPITSEKQIKDVPMSVERTVESISKEATESLLDSYDDRRKHFGLNMTSADDLRGMGNMNPVTVNYNGVSLETANAFDTTIQELSDEYYTGFTRIEVGDKKEFFGANMFATTQHNNAVGQKTLILNPHKTGDYDKMTERIKELSDKGYAVKISEGLEGQYIATHEFAHSLIDLSGNYKNYVNMDVKQMKGIKKEIDSIFDNYKKEVNILESAYKEKELAFLNASMSLDVDLDDLGKIHKEALEAKEALDAVKISKYSMENADEFMAEAFTQSKIGVSQSKYTDDVMGVIDKHFKKESLENTGKSVTMKAGQTKSYTKIKVDDIPSMDETKFNKIKSGLEKNGIAVIQDADGDAYLKHMNAEAMTLSDGSAVIFQSGRVPSASAVFEEMIHTSQIKKNGMIESTGDIKAYVEYLNREIEANEKLLKYKKAYGLTKEDIESVEENLAKYYEDLKGVT